MFGKKLYLVLCSLALVLLAGCGSTSGHYVPSSSPVTPPPTASDALSMPPEPTPAPTPTPEPIPEPTPEPTPAPESAEPYEFGTPLAESAAVEDDSFFDNTVFLGDSRTEGFQLFSGMKHGDFFWARGMTVFRADSEDYRPFEIDGREYSMIEALALKQYDNVYIMLGVNELGYPAESYESGLMALMDKIISLQPNAVIYLQLMPPVNDAMCRQNKQIESYVNNANLSKFNAAIVRVAAAKKVVLLNTAEVYTGPDGQLPAELANDGCHFAYSGYKPWADYIRNHVMDRERYFALREGTFS